MKKQNRLLKLLLFNAGIIILDVILLSPGLVGLSLQSESDIAKALFVTVIVMSLLLLIFGNYYLLKNKTVMTEGELELYIDDADSTREIAVALSEILPLRPMLQREIENALGQIDSMNRKQERIEALFARNQYQIQTVRQTLQDTEDSLARNLNRILNRLMIWDPDECTKPAKQVIYSGHLSYINDVLNKNEKLLDGSDVLLTEVTKYISDVRSGDGKNEEDIGLQSMIETLQQLNCEETE